MTPRRAALLDLASLALWAVFLGLVWLITQGIEPWREP